MGTRNYHLCFPLIKQDHPHAYGDKWIEEQNETYEKGSSPRVWGQVRKEQANAVEDEDHPHAYGDKSSSASVCSSEIGSSPRVWGQVVFMFVFLLYVMDHPHAYGDKLTAAPQPDRV